MVNALICKQKDKKDGLSISKCLNIFGVSRSGYYAWLSRKEELNTIQAEKQRKRNELKEKFRIIVKKLGFVPGKRTFRTYMWRMFDINISVKQCRNIMKEMNFVAKRPKKDAYKNQATHNHEYASPKNILSQNFYVAPRKVVLTDITYLYFGTKRTPIYFCAFKDAYTKEILGHCTSSEMSTTLVKKAYYSMMQKHKKELKNVDCIIHSDQGSQYLSTDFQTLLSDEGFLISVSERGNSWDNAPMESFFGRMKCEILDLIALCKTQKTVVQMMNNYVNEYNHTHYQYSLAGLTPSEYYAYVTTGVYPLDNYYGVKETELLGISELVNARLEKALEKSKKARESRKKRTQNLKNPMLVVSRDINLLKRELKKWTQSENLALIQTNHLTKVLEKALKAKEYLLSANLEILTELKSGLCWDRYIELEYIYDMKHLF